ncbi:hypothetical protein JX266_003968 [Neoarthrinium moseri]|nr:hypothetical protein JX266_003968 [Neoarthrinium moseri]
MILTERDKALFETTKRLLAQVVNEGLCDATVEICHLGETRQLCLHPRSGSEDASLVRVTLKPGIVLATNDNHVISIVRPEYLQPPIIARNKDLYDRDPEVILECMKSWFILDISENIIKEIGRELRNCADNQEKWLQIARSSPKVLTLNDPSVSWEKTLIYGHPSHPYHRLCYAQPPLKPVHPEDITSMLTPTLAFISVPRKDLCVTGPFVQTLQPLLRRLEIPETSSDRVVVPCLVQQLPSINHRFMDVDVLRMVNDCADAQVSLRTLTLRPELNFGYHMKLSLACQITSALRTITPWTTQGGRMVTEILEKFLPDDLWVFREVAAVTGSQSDFDAAKHLSCILRDSLESRAEANGERLVVAAALAQTAYSIDVTYAELLFGLNSLSQKQEWFRNYIKCLFELVLPPLVKYGIGLEAHGQNIVARICQQTNRVKGFAVRDFGGIRLHVPTLERFSVDFSSLPPGGAILTHDMHKVWSKVHHSLLQNHVGLLLTALGLERATGWGITLETLEQVLDPDGDIHGKYLYEYFTQDTMPFKCFLRMRMEGKYRDYIERQVPNVLLTDSPRWESAIAAYQSSLQYT